jgi:hypothetical protein
VTEELAGGGVEDADVEVVDEEALAGPAEVELFDECEKHLELTGLDVEHCAVGLRGPVSDAALVAPSGPSTMR